MENNIINTPALFAPVNSKWIDGAFDYFKNGNEVLYFYSNANLGKAIDLNLSSVYFKLTGQNFVSVVADFVELTEENPKSFRVKGAENDEGKYYYGFKNLRWLTDTIDIDHLEYFSTGNNLRNDVPGACIIKNPDK